MIKFVGIHLRVFMALVLFTACQKDYSLETGRKPGDVICGRIDKIIQNPGTSSENSYILSYDDKGTIINLYDSAGSILYELDYNEAGNLIKKTSSGTETNYHYDGEERLISVEYSYPLASRIDFIYGTGPNPEGAQLFQEENGSMALMHNQTYAYQQGNITSVDYDSIGIVRKDFLEPDMGVNNSMKFIALLEIGSPFSLGYSQPYSYFNSNLISVFNSQRYNNSTQFQHTVTENRLTQTISSDGNGNQTIWVIQYNCL